MSRYIDADALIDKLMNAIECGRRADMPTQELEAVLSDVRNAPSIDIVRCGECKHWERLNYEAPKEGWCDDQMPYSDGRWVDADDFCSYGEPSNSEKPNNSDCPWK